MSLLLTGRYTRTEEERGRTELVRAAAVGRDAPVAAAVAVVAGADVLVGIGSRSSCSGSASRRRAPSPWARR